HARTAKARPATRNAAPTSCTKWGLNGPVSAAPGTLWNQNGPANSIKRPFPTFKIAKTAANTRRMGTSCSPDERERADVTVPGMIFGVFSASARNFPKFVQRLRTHLLRTSESYGH